MNDIAELKIRLVIASEAKQSRNVDAGAVWTASSLTLLAMTTDFGKWT
jgi:hypothetical protein